jgi:hypothetical protein
MNTMNNTTTEEHDGDRETDSLDILAIVRKYDEMVKANGTEANVAAEEDAGEIMWELVQTAENEFGVRIWFDERFELFARVAEAYQNLLRAAGG